MDRMVKQKKKKTHDCQQANYCTCNMSGLEPDEFCPRHGMGDYPPRCYICGRFLKHIKEDNLV